MKDGIYAVKFAAMGNQGGGVATVRDGFLSGGDAGYSYIGSLNGDGQMIVGTIAIAQHEHGYANVFAGLDQFQLDVTGSQNVDGSAHFKGTTSSAPGVPLTVSVRYLQGLN